MVLAVFVDGLGLGTGDPAINPTVARELAVLPLLLSGATPLDACLGIPGLPQSATGQVTLFTGVNAALELGCHFQGFPPPALRRLLVRGTFYTRLLADGYRVAFLNAFGAGYLRRLINGVHPVSCSTLAAISAGVPLRDAAAVRQGRSLYHDVSGERLRAQGESVPLFDPEEAAAVALAVARDYDLTLFEFFLTDHAGHSCDRPAAAGVLQTLDAFLHSILAGMEPAGNAEGSRTDGRPPGRPDPSMAGPEHLVLFSDHGNVEDLTCLTHTANPVPLVVVRPGTGPQAPAPGADGLARDCTTLADVAGLLVALVRGRRPVRPVREGRGNAGGSSDCRGNAGGSADCRAAGVARGRRRGEG